MINPIQLPFFEWLQDLGKAQWAQEILLDLDHNRFHNEAQMHPFRRRCRDLLRAFHLALLRGHRRALRYPRATIAIILIAVLAGLPGLGKLRMLLVINDLMDKNFTTYPQLQELENAFKDKNNAFVIFRPSVNRPPSLDEMCDIRAWVQKLSVHRTDIIRVVSSFGPARVLDSGDHLRFKPLLDVDCGARTLSPATVKKDLEELRNSPWGMSATGRDTRDILVNFYLRDSGNPRFGTFDGSSVGQLMKSLKTDVLSRHPELEAHWSGVAVYQFFTKIGYDQTNVLNLLTFSMVFVLFRLLFGTFSSSALFLISYTLTLIPMFSGMGFFHSPIDVLSNSLSLMMLIACVEDFLYVSYVRLRHPERSWRYAFRVMLIPSFFTSVTTMIGFGSLYAADLSIIRRFGAWAAFAAGLEWVMIFFFLPALLQLWPRLRHWANEDKAFSFTFLTKWRQLSLPRGLAKASLVLLVIGLVGARGLKVQDAPENVFPYHHVLRKTTRLIEHTRGWVAKVSLVFRDLDNEKINRAVLAKAAADPMVAAVESPYKIVDYLRAGLPQARADLVEGLWKLSPFAHRLIDENNLRARAILYLKKTDIVDVNALKARTEKWCGPNCDLAGTLVSYGEFGKRVLSTFIDSMGLSLFLVSTMILFLAFALGLTDMTALLLSCLWGPLTLLAIFVIFRIPIFYVTSVFASILVGLTGDNTIQFMFSRRSPSVEASVQRLGGASILLSMTMCCLSTVLFLSYFAPLKMLGLWMILGLSLALIGDVWILKALAKKPGATSLARETAQ